MFDQLRHIICIMFNYVFMHFYCIVLYCIALYCIIKANGNKNIYVLYHGPIKDESESESESEYPLFVYKLLKKSFEI